MRSSFWSGTLVAIALWTTSTAASGTCAFTTTLTAVITPQAQLQINGRIGQSEDQGLVNAFKQGQCVVWQTNHGGGGVCKSNTSIRTHMTVRDSLNGRTCHVFDYITNQKYCTTCR